MSAVRAGNLFLVETLLRRISPEFPEFGKSLNGNKQNLLHLAVEGNPEEFLDAASKRKGGGEGGGEGGGGGSPEEDKESAKRRVDCLSFILVKFPDFTEAKDYLDRTPLVLASIRGNHQAMAELIRAGADVTTTDGRGSTALHFVVELDRTEDAEECLRELLKVHRRREGRGLPSILEVPNGFGVTPLGRAILTLYKYVPSLPLPSPSLLPPLSPPSPSLLLPFSLPSPSLLPPFSLLPFIPCYQHRFPPN
jgi:ankyrin repeat protein